MRLESAPLGLANPVWVEDDELRPDRHVRRMALPAPGGDAELCELAGQILSEPLDRSRPLWQLTVVEGLARGRTAIVAKMHHALVDGIAAVDVSTVILDPTPEGSTSRPPEPRDAARAPPAPRGLRPAHAHRVRAARPARAGSRARRSPRTADPRTYARQMRSAAGAGRRARARAPARRPTTRLNAEIGRERRVGPGALPLDDVKAVRRATGATVNDVLLTAVALMLSDYLGEDAPE